VLGASLDGPRGPDIVHRVRVPRTWLEQGKMIELTMPRNGACAQCEGGGCDRCERSGAVTLRGKHDPVERVSVTLPRLDVEAARSGVCLRIPERGGSGTAGPRGLLLLRIATGTEVDPGVRLVETPPPVYEAEPSRRRLIAASVALAIVLTLVFWLLLKLSGWA
jgi:hypothetical protein